MKTILLVDMSNLARRNFHGQSLSTSKGVQTGLIYGTINSLLSIQVELKANTVIGVWDEVTSSDWRKALYPAYKANRVTADPEYIIQKERLQDLLNAMGMIQVSSPNAEADDIIGYLSKEHYRGEKVYILSGDKDFYSLVSETIKVISPTGGVIELDPMGKITFKDGTKFISLYPKQVVDYKCLVGDSSDNISGAPGFGIGAAVTFFKHNQGINNILDGSVDLAELRAKAIEGLMMTIPMLEKFRELVTINLDKGKVSIPEPPPIYEKKVDALLALYEFNQFKIRGKYLYNITGV